MVGRVAATPLAARGVLRPRLAPLCAVRSVVCHSCGRERRESQPERPGRGQPFVSNACYRKCPHYTSCSPQSGAHPARHGDDLTSPNGLETELGGVGVGGALLAQTDDDVHETAVVLLGKGRGWRSVSGLCALEKTLKTVKGRGWPGTTRFTPSWDPIDHAGAT